MKKQIPSKAGTRFRSICAVAAMLVLNTLPALAQGVGFNSTDLKTGISNSLAVIMMFGFVLGISSVIYGGRCFFGCDGGFPNCGLFSLVPRPTPPRTPAPSYDHKHQEKTTHHKKN